MVCELGSNAPGTLEDKIVHVRERFDLEMKLLRSGKSHILDRPDWWLVFDALEHLAFLLRHGEATLDLQKILADSFEQVVRENQGKAAYAILGLPAPNGRPNISLNKSRAIAEYEMRINEAAGQSDAERAAWETLYPLKEYDLLAARAVDSEDKSFEHEAERLMVNVVGPLLRKSSVMKSRPVGRPKGSKSKSKP